ncbi:mannose-1-phosphate guanylyltransferase/mannose-6-phosphate isomerase [Sphingopyxis indica]|uniref:mannose-1-phosphate guanylyltransferase/mannose-6-phosphate isomerase n=1 Tax=Sphingopyxis indica TaxID=436663 RepID=UPI0029392E93|nr:mannose-1-phosphate guanylyltransferase/mannose-6-phosphate isomerase [Sphingopyxis indica]WOF44570.1 mannose-1-phosphate guanylyltransferase/mannose-6-phosphate isomerase [Sphingopyxis indica]
MIEKQMIIPVVLSGGSGTRLWPTSSAVSPKQFHALAGNESMFRQTVDRVADRSRFAAPVVVCGSSHVELVTADLSAAGILDARIIVEPAARNTAPAIALAAALCGSETVMLVMPADHVMTNVEAFLSAIELALPAVLEGALATFGIDPSHPETGYGYIAAGEALNGRTGVHAVNRFVEKPKRAAAEAMLQEGGHYWNAGIFLMRADRYLGELARQQPEINAACVASIAHAVVDGLVVHPNEAAFLGSPSNSIDYAVMEGARDVVVVPVDPGWSDVGGWAALYELGAKDRNDNVLIGDVIAVDAQRNYVRAPAGKRISMVGISDLIVVVEGDDILLLPRDRAQEVKLLAQERAKGPAG